MEILDNFIKSMSGLFHEALETTESLHGTAFPDGKDKAIIEANSSTSCVGMAVYPDAFPELVSFIQSNGPIEWSE